MLLVLAVLTLLAGLAWPSISRLHGHHQLRQSADLLAARLAAGRIHAVDTGLTYQFRFEPGGRRFLLVPFDQEADEDVHQTADPQLGSQRAIRSAGMLPGACKFEGGESFNDTGTAVPDEWFSGLPDAADYVGAMWSAPVLFHPNGTATNFEVLLRGRRQEQVKVLMRAITGAVTVAPVTAGVKR